MKDVVISTQAARMASNALREVRKRLLMYGQDDIAAHMNSVAEALEEADTIHIADGVGRA